MPRSCRPTLALLIAVSALCVLLNHDQPLVRNSLVYARAAEHVIAHGYDPMPVVADSRLSYDKPIGFAWLAAPLVAWLGNHLGLMLASLAGTIAYLCAAAWSTRVLDPFAWRGPERALVLLCAGLGPLVEYQSWSGHPDSLFAGLYVVAVGLAHRIVQQPSPLRVVALAVTILVAIVLKNYGMILLPGCTLYLLWHVCRLWRAPRGRLTLGVALGVFTLLAVLVVLGWTGHNPLMRFEGEGGGKEQYGRGSWALASAGTVVQLLLALLLQLHVTLPFALHFGMRRELRREPGRARILPLLTSFAVPYVAGLLLFPTSFYNMRYFIPLFPLAAMLAVGGLRVASAWLRRVVPPAFVLVAAALIAVFNSTPVYEAVQPYLPRLEVNWIGVPLSLLDNLRMPLHRQQAATLAHLNTKVEPGALLYLLDVAYYRDAQQGVYERAGLIRPDIQTRYVSSRGFAPRDQRFYVFGRQRDPAALARLGTVTDLGRELRLVVAK